MIRTCILNICFSSLDLRKITRNFISCERLSFSHIIYRTVDKLMICYKTVTGTIKRVQIMETLIGLRTRNIT